MTSSTEPPSRQAILELLSSQDAPTTPEELAVQLKVGPEAVIPLRRRLAAMQRDGQILLNRKGGLMPVSRIDLVAGKVAGHRDGFGAGGGLRGYIEVVLHAEQSGQRGPDEVLVVGEQQPDHRAGSSATVGALVDAASDASMVNQPPGSGPAVRWPAGNPGEGTSGIRRCHR